MKAYKKHMMAMGFIASITLSHSFELISSDIEHGKVFSALHEFNSFGCSGKDLSPMLEWRNAPKGTEYFAVTVFDPDAPTGSGWWHWQVINIPKNISSLLQGAGNPDQTQIPPNAIQMRNDYGVYGFGGACPPVGQKKHRYQFTIYALPHPLEVPKDASGALVGFMIKANAIGSSTIEALYGR